MKHDFFNQHVLREALGRIGRVPELDDIDYNKRTLSASYQYVIDCFMSLFSAVDELEKELEPLKIKRQTEDEFRAEIWQAIEELRQSQPSPQPIKADPYKMPYIETATNYRALYEKEKEKVINITMFVFKLLEKVNQEQNHHEMISHTRSTTTVISAKKEQLEMIFWKRWRRARYANNMQTSCRITWC